MLRPRGVTYRSLALVTALAFFNLATVSVVGRDVGVAVKSARAETGKERRVALFVLPLKDAQATDAQVLQTLLRQQVDALAGVRLVTGSPDPETSLASEVAPLVEDGIRALNVRDHARADELLGQAYEKLIRHIGVMDHRLMARTLKGLGVARVMSGQLRAGQEMMRASLNLWPDQLPPEYGYTLDVMNAFKEVQGQQLESPNGALALVTEPAGASVAVAGKVPGYTPLNVGDLPGGLQWVQVSLDGYLRAGSFVEVRPGEEGAHRFALQPRPNKEAYDAVIRDLPRALRSDNKASALLPVLNGLVSADESIVVTVGVKGSAYVLQGYYARAAGVAPVSVEITRDATFITALGDLVTGTLGGQASEDSDDLRLDAPPSSSVVKGGDGDDEVFIDPNDPILKGGESDEDLPITSEWWFWVIIGGVAAGLTVGGILLFSPSGEKKGPVGDVRIDIHSLP